jgi:DNA replication and repair protein RecF
VALAVDGRDARRFASQGQQRSVVLSLKLASLELLEERLGDKPVLLLDDVMSELDPRRRAALLPLLGRGQAFVTATDRAGLERVLSEENLTGLVGRWLSTAGGSVTPGGAR